MTDAREASQPAEPDRAERALRDAFARRAEDLDLLPLALPVPRRRRLAALAAVASVVLVAGTSVAVTRDGASRTDPPAATPTSAPTSAPTTATTAAGTRTVEYRGVAVDVPESWFDVPIPQANGCSYPTRPFVAAANPTQSFQLNDCASGPPAPAGFPRAARDAWTPNLQLLDASGYAEPETDGTTTSGDWTLTRRTVDGVVLLLLTDTATASAAAGIVASARTFDSDQNGCVATSPVQAAEQVRPPASDIEDQQTASAVQVCLYDRTTDGPGLLASRTITAPTAQQVLEAIQQAPAGGGPDAPQHCMADDFGTLAMTLRLDAGDGSGTDVNVYFESCRGNGFDDGTTRRALTPEACRPLWGDRVQQYSGSSVPYRVCHNVADPVGAE